ncbi:MAG: carboxypeptidase-like regulatory domain-containing protein [Candidatus Azobacteroides sp.]|nr:carboxypeptidase-like regulatory domain-containing protein [Candidatus Azobacteroides sp.]
MKTHGKRIGIATLFIVLFSGMMNLFAQNDESYFTISGVVKDQSTKKKLEQVNISVPGSNLSGITNEEGAFTLKIRKSVGAKEIEFSRIGYFSTRISIDEKDFLNQTFYLAPNRKQLQEVVVESWKNPEDLVREALKRVASNYSDKPDLLTGFYRETVQKGKKFINISEAVINIYKNSYAENNANADRVQIFKGRKLLTTKASDTLAVKLLGGPNLSVYADIVKNPDILFDENSLGNFNFKMENPEFLDNRQQYVLSFTPAIILPYPLCYGKLYIDKETLAFIRAEFYLDMKDRNKATEAILRKKPAGLRFKPDEVFFVVSYKQRDGKSYLNYIRNEVKFKCDWQRRLFATNYAVVSEMIVTESKEDNVSNISRKESFNKNESLSDKVMNFYDDNFWGAYNIIEPTESLESAVNKLKKEHL